MDETFFRVNPPTGRTGIGGGRKEEVEAVVTGEERERRFGGRESRGGMCLNMWMESKYIALFSITMSCVWKRQPSQGHPMIIIAQPLKGADRLA